MSYEQAQRNPERRCSWFLFFWGGSGSAFTQASPVAAGLTVKAIACGTYLSPCGVGDAIEVTEGAFARVSGLWFTLNDGGGFLVGSISPTCSMVSVMAFSSWSPAGFGTVSLARELRDTGFAGVRVKRVFVSFG